MDSIMNNNDKPIIILEPTGKVTISKYKTTLCVDTSTSTRSSTIGSDNTNSKLRQIREVTRDILDEFIEGSLIEKWNCYHSKDSVFSLFAKENLPDVVSWNRDAIKLKLSNTDTIIGSDTATNANDSIKILAKKYAKGILYDGKKILQVRNGTQPSKLIQNPISSNCIKNSEMLIITTDGVISDLEVTNFFNEMKPQKHLKVIIGIIIGDKKLKKPSEINISVMVGAMLSNSCILFYDGISYYVIWSASVFAREWKPVEVTDESKWEDLTTVTIDKILNIEIPEVDDKLEKELFQKGYLPYGDGMFVNPDKLLDYNPSFEECCAIFDSNSGWPFYRICLHYKMENLEILSKFLGWIGKQKNKYISDLETYKDTEILDLIITGKLNETQKENFRIHRDIDSYLKEYKNDLNTAHALAELFSKDHRIFEVLKYIDLLLNVLGKDINAFKQQSVLKINTGYLTTTCNRSHYSTYCNKSDYTINSPSSLNISWNGIVKLETLRWRVRHRYLEETSPNFTPSLRAKCYICDYNDICFILFRRMIPKNFNSPVNHNTYIFQYPVCAGCADYCLDDIRLKDPFNNHIVGTIPLVKVNYMFRNDFFNNCKLVLGLTFDEFNTILDEKNLNSIIINFLIEICKSLEKMKDFETDWMSVIIDFRERLQALKIALEDKTEQEWFKQYNKPPTIYIPNFLKITEEQTNISKQKIISHNESEKQKVIENENLRKKFFKTVEDRMFAIEKKIKTESNK